MHVNVTIHRDGTVTGDGHVFGKVFKGYAIVEYLGRMVNRDFWFTVNQRGETDDVRYHSRKAAALALIQ